MNLSQFIRVNRDNLALEGVCRYETVRQTVYISSRLRPLLRQKKAMEMLAHLEITPVFNSLDKWRGCHLLTASHPPSQSFLTGWQTSSHQRQVELIRSLGSALGMVHSLRDVRSGPIDCPNPASTGELVARQLGRYRVLAVLRSGREAVGDNDMVEMAKKIWARPASSLVGNWQIFPDVRVAGEGLILKDFSHAGYFDPLWDLVRLDPACLDWHDADRFWEYLLQGYCASGELSFDWRDKLTVLVELLRLQDLAAGRQPRLTEANQHNLWWERY